MCPEDFECQLQNLFPLMTSGSAATEFRQLEDWFRVMIFGSAATQFSSIISDCVVVYVPRRFRVSSKSGFW